MSSSPHMSLARFVVLTIALAPCGVAAQPDGAFGFGFSYVALSDRHHVVTAIAPDGGAEAAGLAPGDSLLSVNDLPLAGLSAADVGAAIDVAREAAPRITLRVFRDGSIRTLDVGQAPYDPDALMRQSRVFFCLAGDCLDGVGTWRSPDGVRYDGAFRDGRRHGEGTLHLADGSLYVGTFRDGEADGRGTFVWPDGTRYVGDIREDQAHGRGTWIDPDGAVYVGTLAAGLRHGSGTYRYPDGSYWTGTWERDEGVKGVLHGPDGSVSVGPFPK